MSTEILMPALSPTMTEGNLSKWLIKKGDIVKAGDLIAEIETDKATMEVEAVDEGVVLDLLFKEGEANIPVNKAIAIIGDPNEKVEVKKEAPVEKVIEEKKIEKNITLESHCEHHMAPIIGVAHVAYIPNKKVVGLSKLARTVEIFSKRLQTQERLTMQIAKTLMNSLDAKGVAVTIDAAHQCMTMRGIKKEQATTVTNYYLGQFKEDLSYQNRYLRLISNSKD